MPRYISLGDSFEVLDEKGRVEAESVPGSCAVWDTNGENHLGNGRRGAGPKERC